MKSIMITADCVCDMSEGLLEQYGVKVIYFYVSTEHGRFKDMEEITSDNIAEYFKNGGTWMKTRAPLVEEYRAFFEKKLKEVDQLIHITMSSKLSLAHGRATVAAETFGERVVVVDSTLFSTGMAHLVIKASELVKEGKEAKDIVSELDEMKQRVVAGFIAESVEYLHRARYVNRFIKAVCELFYIHPVLVMKKGNLHLKTVKIGNYEKAVLRYVKGELRNRKKIETERAFITHAGCSVRLISKVKRRVERSCVFSDIQITEASATISSNCGPNTIGVLYVRK